MTSYYNIYYKTAELAEVERSYCIDENFECFRGHYCKFTHSPSMGRPAGIVLQSTLMPLASKAFLTSEHSSGDGGADAAEVPSSELRHRGSNAEAAVSATNTFKCNIVAHNLKSHVFINLTILQFKYFVLFLSIFISLSGLEFEKILRKVEECKEGAPANASDARRETIEPCWQWHAGKDSGKLADADADSDGGEEEGELRVRPHFSFIRSHSSFEMLKQLLNDE